MGRKTQPKTMLEWALFYASLDLPVVPLVPRGKRPATGSGGIYNATTDAAQIRRWWAQHPEYNVGIRTGEASGLVVVDFDKARPEGFPLPVTPQVRTGGRNGKGLHLYFRATGPLKSFGFSHGEFLADGKCVVAPPSIHESGEPYAWIDFLSLEDCEPAELTDSILERLRGMRSTSEKEEQEIRERGRARKTIGDILSCSLPCSSRDWPFREYAQNEQLAMEIVRFCGGSPRSIGKNFSCPIHKDEKPSVALWRPPDDPNGFISLHHLHPPEPEWIQLCELYAHCKFRRPIPVSGPERPVWWIRLLYSLDRIGLPEVPAPALPPSAPPAAVKLYEGFLLLLRCREAYRAGQHIEGAPYAWRFAGHWSGIRSTSTVAAGLKYLLTEGFLESEIRSGPRGRLTYYKLGVRRPLNRPESSKRLAKSTRDEASARRNGITLVQSTNQPQQSEALRLPEGEDYDADMAAWRAAKGRPLFHEMNILDYERDAAWHAMSLAQRARLVRAAEGGAV